MGTLFVILLVPYGIAAVMPSRRWLAAYVLGAALLLAFWVHAISQTAGFVGGFMIVILVVFLLSTLSGVLVRTGTIAMEARGWNRSVAAVTVAGALIPFAAVAIFAAIFGK